MKKKTKILFGVLVLATIITLGNVNFAWAGCCTNASGDCQAGSSQEECLKISKYHVYSRLECKEIGSCPNSETIKCCIPSCTSPDNLGKCLNSDTPSSKMCSQIESCPSYVGSTSSTTETTTFVNPLGNDVTTISQLLNNILSNLRGILVFIAVIFIVLGGIMYMLSGGNEEMVKRAKKTWTGAIIGLAIALAAPTFLKEIQEILGGNSGGESADAWVSNALTIKQIVINILELLLSILGIVAIISMIIGGGMYLTAYGDEKRIDKAKSIVTYSIIGIVISLSAVIVVKQIGTLLGG